MNETDGWTITQEGRTVRIRDKDGLTVTKFEHDPLTEDELETVLNINKYCYKEIARRLDEYILNGGRIKNDSR